MAKIIMGKPFEYTSKVGLSSFINQEEFERILDEVNREQKEDDLLIEQAKKSIKHPHFKYAFIDFESKAVSYRWKNPWNWLSGKREVRGVVKIKKIKTEPLGEYKKGKSK